MNEDNDSLRGCERVRLLLSLAVDGEATPEQHTEIADHVPTCADCAAAERVDLAVRAHLEARVRETPTGGFGDRVVAAAAELQAARLAMRRMLVRSAAAAALLGAVSAGWLALHEPPPAGSELAMVERTKFAVIAPHAGHRR